MVNPVAGSFSERVPVLVLSGGPGEEERKLGTLIHHQAKEIESQLRIYQELTCAARVLDDPRTRRATTVHEVVQTDLARAAARLPRDPPRHGRARASRCRARSSTGTAALQFARSDERQGRPRRCARPRRASTPRAGPFTIVGIETFRYKLQREVRRLAERMGAPVTTTVLAKGAFPMDHPLYMGVHIGPLSPRADRRARRPRRPRAQPRARC